jgi:hypothetical protein
VETRIGFIGGLNGERGNKHDLQGRMTGGRAVGKHPASGAA